MLAAGGEPGAASRVAPPGAWRVFEADSDAAGASGALFEPEHASPPRQPNSRARLGMFAVGDRLGQLERFADAGSLAHGREELGFAFVLPQHPGPDVLVGVAATEPERERFRAVGIGLALGGSLGRVHRVIHTSQPGCAPPPARLAVSGIFYRRVAPSA